VAFGAGGSAYGAMAVRSGSALAASRSRSRPVAVRSLSGLAVARALPGAGVARATLSGSIWRLAGGRPIVAGSTYRPAVVRSLWAGLSVPQPSSIDSGEGAAFRSGSRSDGEPMNSEHTRCSRAPLKRWPLRLHPHTTAVTTRPIARGAVDRMVSLPKRAGSDPRRRPAPEQSANVTLTR
jgi:hypothetical protein